MINYIRNWRNWTFFDCLLIIALLVVLIVGSLSVASMAFADDKYDYSTFDPEPEEITKAQDEAKKKAVAKAKKKQKEAMKKGDIKITFANPELAKRAEEAKKSKKNSKKPKQKSKGSIVKVCLQKNNNTISFIDAKEINYSGDWIILEKLIDIDFVADHLEKTVEKIIIPKRHIKYILIIKE